MPDRPHSPSETSEPVPSAIRDTVLSMVADPCDRLALEFLGRMVFAYALQCPAPPDTDRTLRPALRAAAGDLRFTAESLSALSPLGAPCDVALSAVAEEIAGTLFRASDSLTQATRIR